MSARELLSIAKAAALAAGKLLLDERKTAKKVYKEIGRDIKLKADFVSERVIIDFLKKRSDFSILSEEKGLIKRGRPGFTWIVDPLDGSLNYMRGIPLACVSIGLWKDEEPFLGVVYDFNRQELFSGIVGVGAWLNENKILCSSIVTKERSVLCTGFPVGAEFSRKSFLDFSGKIQAYKKIRLLGSAALSLAYVACGRADAYFENGIKFWDVAAGIALVQASGGAVNYSPLSKKNAFKVQASNRYLKC